MREQNVQYLTDRFERINAPDRQALLFGLLRSDLRAKSAWYFGRTSAALTLRALLTDGSLCMVLYRLMRFLKRCRLGIPAAIVYKLNSFLTGAVIGRGADFGPGFVVLHSHGLVVNSSVRGGANVILEGNVTVGAEKDRSPILGNNVFVGTGARLLGAVEIGDFARIGANAVVLRDVPPHATAVGVPARVVKTRQEAP